MKAYIAGKVSGLDLDSVRTKFSDAEKRLKDMGFDSFNPVQYCLSLGLTDWDECMKALLPIIQTCDSIYLLPDWNKSKGAKMELKEAIKHKLNVIHE